MKHQLALQITAGFCSTVKGVRLESYIVSFISQEIILNGL